MESFMAEKEKPDPSATGLLLVVLFIIALGFVPAMCSAPSG